jgi:hypothetical protein
MSTRDTLLGPSALAMAIDTNSPCTDDWLVGEGVKGLQ